MALISPISDWHLSLARQVIHTGGVIAYPTEAVWGLGCNPWDRQAVERILELKQRPVEKGVILVAASVDQIRFLLDPLPPELQREAARHWPGPVTCLLPDVREQVPAWVRGQHRSIAVRVSAHPGVRALCEAAGMPLVSTSCNPAGRPPARQPWHVRRYFGDQLDLILPGRLGGNRNPSRIIDIVTGQQLR
ncbi:L-threonylcarbamoyladenylate synthase [Marinobacter lutaoensis]|jgi:L-threonylcarbamoyladenylate synthase|uniref:Threonylcarbamoyl-AMP synthase n=1 Tax=Marinobacter lutaoensis TaxID=135739 RepID=A0A1V2DUS7_9GAMM|nr:L-threonylcarbamoyladenylate synthase [Marinobacter lutaoensis]MBE02993.1 Sua5/YciO/YrdC/YwlC family protein [Marinobacter sp.]MBI43980.1 Sua5/YciO/YrdC/YwlC family protein [Oceanospirillales bacterium]NVD34310.1 L-threonylcarbamoyladenylate synthase [Marinobacter lutaoensis]ONF44453.1 tRNA threonylcarbamoyladenosine biosynthesis protein RimN [Marinobacter lutaoensis]|tara:strand:- start:1427 stop:1999 length:573 start_codon:yes stop_codon:yes gene_type:complete